MKLIRLKITDPKGFRSLQSGFEYYFRKEWQLKEWQLKEEELKEEASKFIEFAPFVCAGPNGSGKSNLLELLAAIFYQLECMVLDNLPDSFIYDEQDNPSGYRSDVAIPDGFELDYRIKSSDMSFPKEAHITIVKEVGKSPKLYWLNSGVSYNDSNPLPREEIRQLLPDYILAYSSGENEILSLPFFKMRFVQYDEYWQVLKEQLPYAGTPESRLVYLDNSFSQAILLCNLLFEEDATLAPFREEVGIKSLSEFRIIIKQKTHISRNELYEFDLNSDEIKQQIKNKLRANNRNYSEQELESVYRQEIVRDNAAIKASDTFEESYNVNLAKLLDGTKAPNDTISRLKRCATCWFEDEDTDSLYLDYSVNEATHSVFQNNFGSALELFQALQVLLTLNLYSVSDKLKTELYQSNSLYVSETVPSLSSDERIMRIKNFWVSKTHINDPVLLKSLSDGEHQLLHTIGLCLLFKNTNSLFLLDEPETHLNPQWRANFISRLRQSLKSSQQQEMLITTHTPFLISDSTEDKVLVFKKDKEKNTVSVSHPEYKTLGASINKITMATFDKRETIGGLAYSLLTGFKERAAQLTDFKTRAAQEENKQALINEINHTLGDSVEKVLLIKAILDSMEESH